MFIGFTGKPINYYPEKECFLKSNNCNKVSISNTEVASWMVQLDDNSIMINREWGASGAGLNIIEKRGNSYQLSNQPKIDLKGLDSPVYMVKNDNQIYISFLGSGGADAGKNSGVGIYDILSKTFHPYHMNDGLHGFHCLTLYNFKGDNKILVSDMIGKKVYLFDARSSAETEEEQNGNFQEIYTFKNIGGKEQYPRHFVQVPNSDKLIFITEKFRPRLYLFQYKNDKLKPIYNVEISKLTNNPNIPRDNLTGAEIQIDNSDHSIFYISLRCYSGNFDPNKPPPASNGYMFKCKLKKKKIKFIASCRVLKTPRYFTQINNQILVGNQESRDLSLIDKSSFNIVRNINPLELTSEEEETNSDQNTPTGVVFILPIENTESFINYSSNTSSNTGLNTSSNTNNKLKYLLDNEKKINRAISIYNPFY